MASTFVDAESHPTTEEMDGLLTPEDIARKYSVFIQCRKCNKWTPADIRDWKELKCLNCGAHDFDNQSVTSARSFNPQTKRKAK